MHRFTKMSLEYRQRAQALGLKARDAPDDIEALKFVHQALAWIQLAENEELLAEHISEPERPN